MKETVDLRKFSQTINPIEHIKNIISSPNVDNDPFYIVDLEDICTKHINWITRLPRVEPHYAIKCNTDHMLIKLLAYLGAGFDCASKNEIQQVLDMGVSPHRIIFANPCKQASNIKYACRVGVDYMTFDNEAELRKIRDHHPNACCVLRIVTNDADAVCRFSMKFGADMETSLKLIEMALKLNLNLVGISFHVGSGQMTPAAFSESIGNARRLFDYARESFGCRMHLLDLGGGYPGDSESQPLFHAITNEINRALEQHFPVDFFAQINGSENPLKIIAEPGRYYAASAFTLCVNVIAKRVMDQTPAQVLHDTQLLAKDPTGYLVDPSKTNMYYINDGVYASFNCLFYDHAVVTPTLLHDEKSHDSALKYKSSIWGPTCDGLDVVCKELLLPEHEVGDYMAFKDMGAYTLSGAVAFNGIPLARCIYVASASWETIKEAFADDDSVSTQTAPFYDMVSCAAAATMTFPRALSMHQEHNGDECQMSIEAVDHLPELIEYA